MIKIALKMLLGDRAKFIGILVGLSFAGLLVTQQSAIFFGLMRRTFGFLTDTGQAQIWVMDPHILHVDDVKPMVDIELFRVRGVPGVAWAVPLFKGEARTRLRDGNLVNTTLIGIDDATLIGGPPKMVEGNLLALRQRDGVIIDRTEGKDKLVKPGPDGELIPIGIGDTIEINENQATVVGISENHPTFRTEPMIYTTYSRALRFAPPERNNLAYILVGAKQGVDLQELCDRIEKQTGLKALTRQQFISVTYRYFLTQTGIAINFGIAVGLGFLVGLAVAGQTFYNFTLDNLRHFGTLKAMGASNHLLLKMILFQALLVGAIGYGVGVGLAALVGLLAAATELSFHIPWGLLVFTAIAIGFICLVSAVISIQKVLKLEPAVVFRV